MSQKGLIYSFMAKGTVVLAEHTSYSGNFSTIAVQCLQKLPSSSSKYTYSCDGHTFNFLADSAFGTHLYLLSRECILSPLLLLTLSSLGSSIFLVVADEYVGRTVPFVFLEHVKDDFMQCYGASITNGDPHPLADDNEDDDLFKDRFSIAYNLDREFGPRLKKHMQYCMTHPEEMCKLSKLKAQITEVKGIMMDNIEKVLDRGERIELLVDKTDNLQFQADIFQRQGRQLRRKMWFQNIQMKLMIGGAVVVIILLFWLISRAGGEIEQWLILGFINGSIPRRPDEMMKRLNSCLLLVGRLRVLLSVNISSVRGSSPKAGVGMLLVFIVTCKKKGIIILLKTDVSVIFEMTSTNDQFLMTTDTKRVLSL